MQTPKWKERTATTHARHLEILKNRPDLQSNAILFLGDSMMERWLTTGKPFWDNELSKYPIMNAGVGGDRIENLLWRVLPTTGPGILDVASYCASAQALPHLGEAELPRMGRSYSTIFLMIGTNNIEKSNPENVASAIQSLLQIIFDKQPNVKRVILYGLTLRSDVPHHKITDLNRLLSELCAQSTFDGRLIFTSFSEKLNEDRYFDDHVHLSRLGYEHWLGELMPYLSE